MGAGSQRFVPSSILPSQATSGQGTGGAVGSPGHEPVPIWGISTCRKRVSQLGHVQPWELVFLKGWQVMLMLVYGPC